MAEPRSPLGIYMAQQQQYNAATNTTLTPPSSDVNHSEGRPVLKRQKSVTSPAVAPPGYVVIQPYDATYKNFPSKRKVTSYHYRGRTISSPEGSMELLRKCMQKHINNTLVEAIKPYKELFEKGAQNCRDNCGEEVDPDRLVRTAVRHSLEQCGKEMFGPLDASLGSSSASMLRKAKRSLSSSDGGAPVTQVVRFKRRKGRPRIYKPVFSERSYGSRSVKQEPVRKEGPKWDPERLTTETKFIMGSRANRAMGLGATRGRLYYKHPDLFKYSSDTEDKQWLFEHRHMPATGGKVAYLLIVEDVLELAETDEYRNNEGLQLELLVGFQVPPFMLEKMKVFMRMSRTDTLRESPAALKEKPDQEITTQEAN
ncbi:Deoxynucleotidyltransferase terminal-interacting protein 1 [Branchiostoma belcheri]|nr:Deoxynucleotidyltransferase terminal-interacting protein 1 [Branchiostoma belcheri]